MQAHDAGYGKMIQYEQEQQQKQMERDFKRSKRQRFE